MATPGATFILALIARRGFPRASKLTTIHRALDEISKSSIRGSYASTTQRHKEHSYDKNQKKCRNDNTACTKSIK